MSILFLSHSDIAGTLLSLVSPFVNEASARYLHDRQCVTLSLVATSNIHEQWEYSTREYQVPDLTL